MLGEAISSLPLRLSLTLTQNRLRRYERLSPGRGQPLGDLRPCPRLDEPARDEQETKTGGDQNRPQRESFEPDYDAGDEDVGGGLPRRRSPAPRRKSLPVGQLLHRCPFGKLAGASPC